MAATVLIVEDDEDLNDLLCLNLTRAGYRVVQARDGQEAMQAIRHEIPDAALLDILLPRADGWEVCRFLEGIAAPERIPVIIITARRDQEDIGQARRMGVAGYFIKPFGMAALLETVRRSISHRESGALHKLPDG